jgi:uncharacterized protein YecE (DUF72 family)
MEQKFAALEKEKLDAFVHFDNDKKAFAPAHALRLMELP